MRNRLATLLALPLLLGVAACGGEEDPGQKPGVAVPLDGRQQTADGKASFVLPKGWVKSAYELDGPVKFAAIDALDATREIFVTEADSLAAAEDAAVFMAGTLAQGTEAAPGGTCERDRKDTTYGGTYRLVDCAWSEPVGYRKVLIALGDEDHGAMLMVAGRADERADLAELITPLLASWRWE
jgi:hypothetical protein